MSAQEDPKKAQETPKTAPRGAKEGKHESKDRAFRPQRPPGGTERLKEAPKKPQEATERLQEAPKRTSSSSSSSSSSNRNTIGTQYEHNKNAVRIPSPSLPPPAIEIQ